MLKRVIPWSAAAGFAVLVLAVYAFWIEPSSLVVRERRIELPGWPAELAGLRIAALADLHVGSPYWGLDSLRRAVEETNAARPDLILLLGDYVVQNVAGGRFVAPRRIAAVLHDLEAPLGVWAVLGNHDWWLDPTQVREALEAAGIGVLEDRAERIETAAAPFWIGGISDFWEGPHEVERMLEFVSDAAPLIAFTHNPDVFPEVPPRVSLLIAGHTHGGQVKIPFLGRPIVPSRYGERYALGLIEERGQRMFVTTGIGTSIIPVRFLTPPEISVLEIRPAD